MQSLGILVLKITSLRYYSYDKITCKVKALWKKEEPLLRQLEISQEMILKLKEQFVLILGISNIEI